MKTTRKLHLLLLLLTLAACPPAALALTDAQLQEVRFVQYPDRQLPLSLPFVNDRGETVHLGDYFAGNPKVPVILVPGYFRCRMLCTGVTDGLIHALQGNRKTAGHEFRVVYVSIDPQERLSEAQARRRTWIKRYARIGADCDYLSGTQDSITRFTEAIGYHYRYDPQSGEFAHPAGFLVARPDGRISHYFFGVAYSAKDLDAALDTAAQMQKGSLVRQFILLCFHYNPVHSRYGNLIMMTVRGLAFATIFGLVYLVVRSKRVPKKKAENPNPTPAP